MVYILLPYICWKMVIYPFKRATDIMFWWKMTKLCMVYWQGRAIDRVRHSLAHCQSPRSGGGFPMVGIKLITKPVDGLHSTAKYFWKRVICPFKRVRDIMFLVKNDKVMYGLFTRSSDRPSDRPSKALFRTLSIPALRWWVSDGRNEINNKTRRLATFYCHIFVERG